MDTMPYKLLIADTENSVLALINGTSGEIEVEWSFPREYAPLDICLSPDGKTAYIPANQSDDHSVLFIFSLDNGLSQLPFELPVIEQFAPGSSENQAFLVSRNNTLHVLDIKQCSSKLIGHCDSAAICVGLKAEQSTIYTVWQQEDTGVLAIFTPNGDLLSEQHLPGLPTNLSLSNHYVYIPFTTAATGSEGMLLFKKDLSAPPAVIRLNDCSHEAAFRIHPCFVAVPPDESFAYIVHEESVNISIVEIATSSVIGYIPVGRSVSCLTLLPDAKFAIAGSNMFADLSLVDLVNRRLLSLTDSDREVFGKVALFPSDH